MRVLIVDNEDAFTHTLIHLILGAGIEARDLQVVGNRATDIPGLRALAPEALVVASGPDFPQQSGITLAAIRGFYREIPVFGVNLGHQAAGVAFGARLMPAPLPMHGRPGPVFHEDDPLFAGIDSPFFAGRYHTHVVEAAQLPSTLKIIARDGEGLIMALRHRRFPLYTVQFQPESFLTGCGAKVVENFFALARQHARPRKRGAQRPTRPRSKRALSRA